jgi:glycosyltransferase involved in cell wall biosynthesis
MAFVTAFRRFKPDVVMAEYGPVGAFVREACQRTATPLVVHFHGFDASVRSVLDQQRDGYRHMFGYASGIVAVSRAMERALIALGAPPQKILVNACGVDTDRMPIADPASAPPIFLAVGRFVPKKAPHLTLLAFARVHQADPAARLTMIGDGPLLPICRELARGLEMDRAVSFLGAQPHGVVLDHMRRCRVFVQHSVEAPDGDCEGTPVAVLEASACGLPVVATRHAGIPDVVLHETTGIVVEEHDIRAMSAGMLRLSGEPGTAAAWGEAGRARIAERFTMRQAIDRLAGFLRSCASPAN